MKLNKKQLDAVSGLKTNLDELSNKPRRLFSSLFEFVEAFIPQKTQDDKEHYNDVVADIMEWQDMFYKNIKHYSILEDCGRSSRETRKELIKKIPERWTEEEVRDYRQGVDDATRKMALIMTKRLIEELY